MLLIMISKVRSDVLHVNLMCLFGSLDKTKIYEFYGLFGCLVDKIRSMLVSMIRPRYGH